MTNLPAQRADALDLDTLGRDGWHELAVANPTFLLERLGSECTDLQGLRELTVNGLDAVNAHGGSVAGGRVVWDLDWLRFDASGGRVRKLSVTDTGTGMTAEQLHRYINQLASSGREQSARGNFGVGAKVAAGSRNPHGLEHRSWHQGRGSLVSFKRHPVRQRRTKELVVSGAARRPAVSTAGSLGAEADYDDAELDRLADLLADRPVERLGGVIPGQVEPLVDAAEIARLHGKSRSWVYDHAGELVAVRLGSGPRPRLGFARARVANRLERIDKPVTASPPELPKPRRRRQRAGRTATGASLRHVRPVDA
jgi:Histidine kinase-, DNA gyrase B-, and HSP90-like ATPase